MATTKKQPPKKEWRNLIWYFLIALMAISILTTYLNDPKTQVQMDFSQFMNEVDSGTITEINIRPSERVIVGKSKSNMVFKTYFIEYPNFIPELREKGIIIKVNPTDSGWVWSLFVQAFLPFLLIGLLWFFIFRPAQSANNQALSFGKSKVSAWKKEDKEKKSFDDVAGCDEAIEELKEIVEYLKKPEKFKAIGAKIPKGALLMGPPGTGKTLLAKAVAGEADVPFFSLSGSDFVEMFVGVGASRVRDLFTQARKNEPCIIFLDEIDAVGRHRGAGVGGGHDEREQTLNQLLVEMDGFDPKHTVIVLAATNRPDILDPALQRPGRFDRQIVVDKPDIKGREEILEIHATGKRFCDEIDLAVIARRTPGFTGADLANLMNEGALLAARMDKKIIDMTDLEAAIDRVIAGPERKSRVMSPEEKEKIAVHELGHAIVAAECEGSDPVHKISILPRGMALGYTLQLPEGDKFLVSRTEMENQIKVLMGGRIAEELVYDEITTGASNDIERATELARNYICTYGMSRNLGPRKYGKTQSQVFMGKDYSDHSKDYSEATAGQIDHEIMALIQNCYEEATTILSKNRKRMDQLTKVLLDEEVIDGVAFLNLFRAKNFAKALKESKEAEEKEQEEAKEETKEKTTETKPEAEEAKPKKQKNIDNEPNKD